MQLISPVEQTQAQKILVIKYRGLGDSIITFGAIELIKETFPQAAIYYMISPEFVELYQHLQSDRVQLVSFNIRKASGFLGFVQFLLKHQFNFIFEFHQIGRTGKFFKLLKPLLKGRYYFHNHFTHQDEITDSGVRKPTIQKDLDLLISTVESLYQLKHQKDLFLKYTPKLKLNKAAPKRNQIIFSMVASKRFRTWPTSYFNELAWQFYNQNSQTEVLSPVSDWPVDAILKKEIGELQWPATFKIVQPALANLPELLAESKLFIGHDTGQKHLAVALGVPTITFFGPSLAHEWHPYSQQQHLIFFQEDLACRTAEREYCEKENCANRICLTQFKPETVLQAIQKRI